MKLKPMGSKHHLRTINQNETALFLNGDSSAIEVIDVQENFFSYFNNVRYAERGSSVYG